MINSVKTILDELDYIINTEDTDLAKFFNENGYCIIPKSNLIIENIDEYRKIIDSLLQKESWRGGWEGKEEYMKYKKDFQVGAYRLGNLFNKHELFLKLLERGGMPIGDTAVKDMYEVASEPDFDFTEEKKLNEK